MRPPSSIRGLVHPSVDRLVGPSAFVKIGEKWTLTDSKGFRQCWTRKKEGQGGRRDEEEGAMRRKEQCGGRGDEGEGATGRKEQ